MDPILPSPQRNAAPVAVVPSRFQSHQQEWHGGSGGYPEFRFSFTAGGAREISQISTVYLFGDFPVYADPNIPGSGNGTDLQDEDRENTPWLAGCFGLTVLRN